MLFWQGGERSCCGRCLDCLAEVVANLDILDSTSSLAQSLEVIVLNFAFPYLCSPLKVRCCREESSKLEGSFHYACMSNTGVYMCGHRLRCVRRLLTKSTSSTARLLGSCQGVFQDKDYGRLDVGVEQVIRSQI